MGKVPKNGYTDGPYVLSKWTPGAGLKLTKNPEYWDHKNVRIPKIEYIPISDENSELNLYRAGQLDITMGVPPNALRSNSKGFSKRIMVAPYLGTVYYAFNLHTFNAFW